MHLEQFDLAKPRAPAPAMQVGEAILQPVWVDIALEKGYSGDTPGRYASTSGCTRLRILHETVAQAAPLDQICRSMGTQEAVPGELLMGALGTVRVAAAALDTTRSEWGKLGGRGEC